MEIITHPTIIFAAATASMTMFMLHQRQKVKIIVETKKKNDVKLAGEPAYYERI